MYSGILNFFFNPLFFEPSDFSNQFQFPLEIMKHWASTVCSCWHFRTFVQKSSNIDVRTAKKKSGH